MTPYPLLSFAYSAAKSFSKGLSRVGRTHRMALLLAILTVLVVGPGKTDEPSLVRFSKPETLTFFELVQVSQEEKPEISVAAKMEKLLHTPFVSNQAYLDGVKPNRPSSEALGPFIRTTFWNIERGIELDGIKVALTNPDQFDKVIAEKKDPESNPLPSEELATVKTQLVLCSPPTC